MSNQVHNLIRASMQGLIESKDAEIYDALENMSERFIRLRETGVSSRVFYHWKDQGLIEYELKGRNVLLNTFEYLWIMCLDSMRRFGLSLDIIRNAKRLIGTDIFDMLREIQPVIPKL